MNITEWYTFMNAKLRSDGLTTTQIRIVWASLIIIIAGLFTIVPWITYKIIRAILY